jgi:alpha-L-fucosidase
MLKNMLFLNKQLKKLSTMKKQFIIFFYIISFFICASRAQEKSSYVTIDKTDNQSEIIKKAANVVPSERQLRWQKLEMVAFFHFGMNTFTGKEWGDGTEDPKLFNPKKLNAEQWVKTAKDAGFKQVILTTKHHDGFCLWQTNTTEHSVKNSDWKGGKGDVVKDVSEACKKFKVGFGVYLSPWDRNCKYYGTEKYNDYFVEQLTELLTKYGKIDEVWFDGACGEGPNGKKQVYDFMRWYALIRKLQPQAVIAIMGPDVRWVGTESGKGRTTEWSVIPNDNMDITAIAKNSQKDMIYKPLGDLVSQNLGGRDVISSAKGLVWYPAETDVSIRPGWFYHSSEDLKVKTPGELMDIYFSSIGMNSVLLLNIPPDKDGLISKYDVKNLQGFKHLRDDTFKKNLAKGAIVKSINGKNEKAILDNNYNTYFTTNGTDTTTVIDISLPAEKTFNILSLQENITIGQRVENFKFEYLGKDGKWIQITNGTTIGYKRLLQFDAVTAKKLRLKILSSRLNPTISEFGIYLLNK